MKISIRKVGSVRRAESEFSHPDYGQLIFKLDQGGFAEVACSGGPSGDAASLEYDKDTGYELVQRPNTCKKVFIRTFSDLHSVTWSNSEEREDT